MKDNLSFNIKEISDSVISAKSKSKSNLDQMKDFFKDGRLLSPMPGKIIDLRCVEGDSIEKGKIIIILEAMKMENEIVTPFSIKIKKIAVSLNDLVGEKQLLIEYES
jgi:biotin carboxyl carrier protein